MEINKAKEIVWALAEGIDPTTGELLPEDSVYNKGDIVRALYAVLNACEDQNETCETNKKEPEAYDTVLYERLKALRTKLAAEKNAPAFTVFANATLMRMAEQKPTCEEEMRRIYGIGDCKMRQYGKIFLAEIQNYLAEINN